MGCLAIILLTAVRIAALKIGDLNNSLPYGYPPKENPHFICVLGENIILKNGVEVQL